MRRQRQISTTKILLGLTVILISPLIEPHEVQANPYMSQMLTSSRKCQHGSTVFYSTGADQTFHVPNGCTSFTVKAWGAGGGAQYKFDGCGWPGGAGGYTTGTIGVTSPTYTVIVGSAGATNSTSTAYGGGGSATSGPAGGGGGRSAIALSGTDLLTAGGGGGGYSCSGSGNSEAGGNGGGTSGTKISTTVYGGSGGTSTAGGTGCTGISSGTQYAGSNGSGFGAGGGGGWYGGAGGGAVQGEAGGGGGGSGYCGGAHVSNCSMLTGSGITAPNTSDPNYVSGVGAGGPQQYAGGPSNGGSGLVVVSY